MRARQALSWSPVYTGRSVLLRYITRACTRPPLFSMLYRSFHVCDAEANEMWSMSSRVGTSVGTVAAATLSTLTTRFIVASMVPKLLGTLSAMLASLIIAVNSFMSARVCARNDTMASAHDARVANTAIAKNATNSRAARIVSAGSALLYDRSFLLGQARSLAFTRCGLRAVMPRVHNGLWQDALGLSDALDLLPQHAWLARAREARIEVDVSNRTGLSLQQCYVVAVQQTREYSRKRVLQHTHSVREPCNVSRVVNVLDHTRFGTVARPLKQERRAADAVQALRVRRVRLAQAYV